MGNFFKNRLQKERLRWLWAAFICAFAALLFSNDFSKKSLASYFLDPIELLKDEQRNPFEMILTNFKPKEFPECLGK
jgi:hypothetical protein